MTDIELVIKIPKKTYKLIRYKNALGCGVGDIKNIIRNGTPLPKGHGRLIDADVLWDLYHSNDYDFYEALDEAPTIIEAERSEEE